MSAGVARFWGRWLRREEFRVDGEPVARMIKWTVLSTDRFKMFFHKFNGPDWTRDPHDHPAYFISIGLKGSYVEAVYDQDGRVLYEKEWRAPWCRKFPATHIHRTVAVGSEGAFTLCFTGSWSQPWSFFMDGERVGWRNYLKGYRSRRLDKVSRKGAAKGAQLS